MRTLKGITVKVLALILFVALPFSVMSQTLKEAVDAYNEGAALMKTDPAGAIKAFEKCASISEQLGEEGTETKTNAEKQLPTLYYTVAMNTYKTKDYSGAIKGFDLAAMARNTKAAFGLEKKTGQRPKTDFAELTVPFTIKNGLFDTPLTFLKSPLIRLEAKGNAHLVEESLDFRVDPKVVASLKGQGDEQERSGLLVPVIISGTFSAPKFKPDMEALAKQTLDVDKKELEAKAKETLDQKLGEQSGMVKGLLGGSKASDEKSGGEVGAEAGKEKEEKTEDKAKGLIKGFLKKD